jgi:hypothetical protein
MGSEVIIIGEVVSAAISGILLYLKNKGYSDEQCNALIKESMARIEKTRPEDLPIFEED